jgi:uncharacterized protein YbaP (TraB family)
MPEVSRMRRPLLAALAGLLALGLAAQAAAEPPIWVVRDKDSEIVLFGSVHVLPKGLEWRPPALVKALSEADDLWFELPIDPQSEALTSQLATAAGVLAPDQSLLKLLGPKDAARIEKLAAAYDVSPVLLDRLKPWLAEIALTAGAYRKFGADASSGVEQAISSAAPAAKREAFETPAEQIGLLSGGTQDEQLASLRETMGEMETKPDEFATLVKAWTAGDIGELRREALDPMRKASPSLFKRLVSDRNARWTEVLADRLKGHGHTVVVVGVGHLIGPESVPARLRALGYSVTGP